MTLALDLECRFDLLDHLADLIARGLPDYHHSTNQVASFSFQRKFQTDCCSLLE